VIEQQPVLAPPGEHVQREAHLPQEGLRGAELAQFARGEKAVADQLVERLRAEMALGDPADGLYVAQAAGARLDVGFEIVGRVVVAMMAGGLLGNQIGSGNTRSVMTVGGAAGGAFAGDAIEGQMKKQTEWRVTVRLEDGSVRTLSQSAQPPFAVGDRVRIVNGSSLERA